MNGVIRIALAAVLCFSAAAQQVKFEVLSIRPMTGPAATNTAPSPNGFSSRLSVWQAIMVAYASGDALNTGATQLTNTPNWIGDFYDFNGRVAQSDLKAWQSQGSDHELLRSALRAALKERFHLAIHEQPSTGKIYELVVGKGGPRLKAATPGATMPAGEKLPSGGVRSGRELANGKTLWECHGLTMQDLVAFLNIVSQGIPVRDKTGLTGHYDFTVQETDLLSEDENHVFRWPVDRLGLRVKAGTESRPILVVDHIDKPTPN